jgi:exopolyphosphatase/guanosine-5'-triphosphate,3'-diphosphate pyrophosphatase
MRVAAVDIGTNTVRLLVADRDESLARLAWVRRAATVTRLGRGVDAKRSLHPEAVARTLAALEDYRGIIAEERVTAAAAVATSAVRDVVDAGPFLDVAGAALGVRPRLISGEEEARLSFLGVGSGLGAHGSLLVVDPGGGSTEFVMGDSEPSYAVSVDVGSVRLTERHLPAHPAAPGDVAAAGAEVDRVLEAVELPARPAKVVGVGGTFTSLAAILLDLPEYDPARVHGASFDTVALAAAVEQLAGMTVSETAAIPSLDPARAPVLLGGAIIVARALAHVRAAEVVVSEADILDGVALEMI